MRTHQHFCILEFEYQIKGTVYTIIRRGVVFANIKLLVLLVANYQTWIHVLALEAVLGLPMSPVAIGIAQQNLLVFAKLRLLVCIK